MKEQKPVKKKTKKEEKKRPRHRPSGYNIKLVNKICAKIAEGNSLNKIIKNDDTMPSMQTIFTWLSKHQEFLDNYVKAREQAAEVFAEEIIDIADDGTNDYYQGTDDQGNPIEGWWKYNSEHVNRSRLRVDARKWAASKLKPKKYGERLELEGNINNLTLEEMLKKAKT